MQHIVAHKQQSFKDRPPQCFGDAEVRDHRGARRRRDVLRLDVAVHNPTGGRVRQRLRDVPEDRLRLGDRKRSTLEPRAQALAVHIRHGTPRQSVHVAGRDDSDDVWLLKCPGERDLALKALSAQTRRQVWRKHLHYHAPAETRLLGHEHA